MGNLKLQIWEIHRITDQHPLWPPWERPVWAHWRPHWCPWTGSGGLNLCWSNPFPPVQSAPRQSGSSSSSDAAYILQSSLYSKQSPWLPWAFAGSTRSKEICRSFTWNSELWQREWLNISDYGILTSSMTMTSGYLSSDRKLKMHHTLKASLSEMSKCFVCIFFL